MSKDDYYYKLGAVTHRALWHDWVLYMLEAIEKTAVITNNLINEILQQMDVTLEYGKTKIRWYNKEINEAIFSQPYIKPKILGDILEKTSRTTLTKYMAELTEAKILVPKKEGTKVYYLNEDLIRILKNN